jgi:hypothetical protein
VLSWRNSVNRKSPPVTEAAPAPIDAEVTASRRYSAPTVKRSSGASFSTYTTGARTRVEASR